MKLTKPVIVAIEGYAVAQGLELALLGDFRVVAEDAVMAFSNRKLGKSLEILCAEAKEVLLNTIIFTRRNLISVYFKFTFTYATTKLVSSTDFLWS